MIPMTLDEIFRLTFNSTIVALIYTALGALVSFMLYYIFDEYNDEWKEKPSFYKFLDVTLEISILALVSFWSSYIIITLPPILFVRQALDSLTDNYSSNLFYIFAVFIFLDDLTEKLKHLYNDVLGPVFDKIFPQYGSITDLSLSYTPLRKTDEVKMKQTSQQWTVSTYL
jgi:hypothetical protein